MNKKLLLCVTPLLLLFFIPFDIPLARFFYTLEPYGSANPYILTASLGLTFTLLFDYQLKHPLPHLPKDWPFISLLFIGSLLIRILLLDFESDDYQGALSQWFNFIKENGGFIALKERGFSDYNSVYLYLVTALTYLPVKSLYSIKFLSILFDYFGAYWGYKILRLKYPTGNRPIFAAIIIVLTPTVFINSSMWAQCDMMYASFLLMSVYFVMKAETLKEIEQPFLNSKNPYFLSLLAFAFAFTFKLQSVFLVILLFWLYLSQRVKLGHYLLIPIVWFVSLIPNWLAGRSFTDLLLIYPRQVFKANEQLTYNAPSVYQLFPDAPFEITKNGGVVFTLLAVLLIGWYLFNYRKNISLEGILLLATFSLMLIPFLLPKMHERYFFPADVFTIVTALYLSKRYWIPITMVVISFISYTPFLFKQETAISFPILSVILGGLIWYVWKDFKKYA